MTMMERFSSYRWGPVRRWTLLSLLIVTPLGFALKLYPGPGRNWVNNFAAGVLYELFWCLLLFLALHPAVRPGPIALAVLLATSTLEFLQLWHPPPLEALRATFLGRTLLGTTFSWWDLPHYLLGCGIGWLWTAQLARDSARTGARLHPSG